MKPIIKINLVLIALYILLQSFNGLNQIAWWRWLRSTLELAALLAAPGLSAACLLQIALKKKFDFWEFINIACASALVIMPLFLNLAVTLLRHPIWWLPSAGTIFFLILLLIFWVRRPRQFENFGIIPKIEYPGLAEPFWWVLFLNLSISITVFSAYFSLPELDPYYWVQQLSNFSNASTIPQLPDRPLFLALAFIIYKGAHVDMYAIFKYVLPLFSILYLPAAWLVARRFSSRWQQSVILLMPLFDPSTILYQQTPMPQLVFIIVTWYFLFWLIYAAETNKRMFFILAGALSILSYFIHEIGILIFIAWLTIAMFLYRKTVTAFIRSRPTVFWLLVVLVVSHYKSFQPTYLFLSRWLAYFYSVILNIQPNLLYPAQYTNVDHNAMGWSGWDGVLKFYLFYAGPPVILILLISGWLLLMGFKKNAIRNLASTARPEHAIILIIFAIFFSISEIIPRVLGTALLPDRAWIFTGIFASFLIIPLFRKYPTPHLPALLLICVGISIAGAIYINNLKQFITTPAQLESAQWIRDNLPSNRIIISSGNNNLITYHANSRLLNVPPDLFCGDKLADDQTLLSLMKQTGNFNFQRTDIISSYLLALSAYLTSTPAIQQLEVENISSQYLNKINDLSKLDISQLKARSYIYFAEDDPRNPYKSRPYMQTLSRKSCKTPVFTEHPQKFQLFYEVNGVQIWKILP